MRKHYLITALLPTVITGCLPEKSVRIVPAQEYTDAVREGTQQNFSFFDVQKRRQAEFEEAAKAADDGRGSLSPTEEPSQAASLPKSALSPELAEQARAAMGTTTNIKPLEQGENKWRQQGFKLQHSVSVPETEATRALQAEYAAVKASLPPPAGSSAPYYMGQMGSNPSLWPDESQGSSLFRDLRAFQPMDVVTIVINEAVEGQKRTQTDSQSRFTLLAAIANLFNFLGDGEGADTAKWVSNNAGLDPENLINAQTNSVYQGIGQTRRLGSLRGKMSAVVLEVLPNGLLRIEGTKIISVDNEEEVMVVSGLARLRDIDSLNQIDSARIANMRIDFYGKGVAGDVTELGWATRLIRKIWPF